MEVVKEVKEEFDKDKVNTILKYSAFIGLMGSLYCYKDEIIDFTKKTLGFIDDSVNTIIYGDDIPDRQVIPITISAPIGGLITDLSDKKKKL